MTHRGTFQPLPFCDSVRQVLLTNSVKTHEINRFGKTEHIIYP